MQISPQDMVNHLNDLLKQDPVYVTRLFAHQTGLLDLDEDYASKMIFVCSYNSLEGWVETGVLGMMNGFLHGTGLRLAYIANIESRKVVGNIHEFILTKVGE